MIYCQQCLTTDLRPNAAFENGVCIACHYSDSDTSSNGALKLKILTDKIKVIQKKRRKKGAYDCIVGVSGGKDSTRQAHWVRDRLGLRPLLVCSAYPPKQMSEIGAKNLSNLMSMGFDLVTMTPAPKTSAALSLESFRKFGNVCKSTEMALFSTVPRLAIDLNVSMIFWGENPALQVGDSAVEGIDEFDGNNLRSLNTLVEGGDDWIKKLVTESYKIDHYIYPTELEFERKKINLLYLGAAWDDWSNDDNSTYASLQGLTLRPDEESLTGDISNASMLDEEFTNINMMLKYYKFGFGRATDIVNERIRSGRLTRDEGIEIANKYDGVCSDSIIKAFSKYVGISVEEFWNIANNWVNADIFEIRESQSPIKRFNVGTNYDG
jgi:N-acetyl sugar amidotransferase